MKKLIFILSLFISISSLLAQNSILKGKVFDDSDGEPLIGATVKINYNNIGATTNYDGVFQLNYLKAGKFTITVSYIGYSEKIIEVIKI